MRLIDIAPCEKLGHAMVLYATEDGMLVQVRSCDMPTIDAVPVVRCGECIHYEPCEAGKDFCCFHAIGIVKDDFCSYGERKDGDGDA